MKNYKVIEPTKQLKVLKPEDIAGAYVTQISFVHRELFVVLK